MGARSLTFKKVTIDTSGGPLAVRGLSSIDIAMLAARYPEAVAAAFEMFKSGSMVGVDLMPIITGFPALASDIIAVATGDFGDEEGMAACAQIPVPEQVKILQGIGTATFSTSDEIKKFVATAQGMVQGARETVPELS